MRDIVHNLTQNGLYSILKAKCTYAYLTVVCLFLNFGIFCLEFIIFRYK
jgi:hypothetical protein